MTAAPKPPMTMDGLLWRTGVLGVFTIIVAYMLGMILVGILGGGAVDFSAHSQRAWGPGIALVSIALATAMSGAQTAVWAAGGMDEVRALGVLRLTAMAGAPPIVIAALIAASIGWAETPSGWLIAAFVAAFVLGPLAGVLAARAWIARRAATRRAA